ncbi:MAG TPA: helix-turn-helix transcriptional regulator [Rariglobus sp.]
MRVLVRRFDVQLISPEALASYMKFRDESTRSLGEKVGCSHGTIHNMVRGNTTNVPEVRAKKIARVLNVPVEALFKGEVSIVQRDVPPKGKAA